MGFTEKLDDLMWERRINKSQLSRETGIPYTTIDSFYKKGTDNIKLSTLKKLSSYFNVSLDYLTDDDITDKNHNKSLLEKSYYLDDEAAKYAEQIHKDGNLKVLFDASKNVSKEDLEFVIQMINKLKRN